jgi:hypothetical protein
VGVFAKTFSSKREECTQRPKIIPKGHKIHHMIIKYSKWTENIPTFFAPGPSKIYKKVKIYHLATQL